MNVLTPVTRYSAGAAGKCEASDHRPLYNKIHRPEWRCGALPFQDFEEVSVIWFGLIRVALLEGIGDTFGDWPAQRLIRIPPHQTVVLSRGADDSLCVLIYLGVVMPFQSIFLLGIHIAAADFDGIQFIASDATVQNFPSAGRGVKKPHSISLDEGDWQWPFFVSHHDGGTVRILGVHNNRTLLLSFGGECSSSGLISNRILRGDQIFTARAENLLESRHIKAPRSLNQCVGGLFSRRERLLALRRRLGWFLLR